MLAESINDALVECVKACGGSKVVGVALWPSKGVEAAQRQLLACLNPDRAEKLGPEESMLIARMAREKGCHAYIEQIAAELSYSMPTPIEPHDELGELLRLYLARREADAKHDGRLERLLSQHLSVRSAA